jgi:hypothetical protein
MDFILTPPLTAIGSGSSAHRQVQPSLPGYPGWLLCKAKDFVAALDDLLSLYSAPAFIRSDNAPEFIAYILRPLA